MTLTLNELERLCRHLRESGTHPQAIEKFLERVKIQKWIFEPKAEICRRKNES